MLMYLQKPNKTIYFRKPYKISHLKLFLFFKYFGTAHLSNSLNIAKNEQKP